MMSTLTGTSIESPLESVTRTKIESPSGGALTGTAAVRALRVVLDPPVLEQHLRLEQAVELLDGQELVAQPAVERLDVWVLPRRPNAVCTCPSRAATRSTIASPDGGRCPRAFRSARPAHAIMKATTGGDLAISYRKAEDLRLNDRLAVRRY